MLQEWIYLENVMLSEFSQSQRQILSDYTYKVAREVKFIDFRK